MVIYLASLLTSYHYLENDDSLSVIIFQSVEIGMNKEGIASCQAAPPLVGQAIQISSFHLKYRHVVNLQAAT